MRPNPLAPWELRIGDLRVYYDVEEVVVTDAGRPVAALVLLENTDLETVALSTDPEFLEIIQSSRARQAQQGGLSSAQMRRRLEDEVKE